MDVRDKLLHAAVKVFEEAGSRGATTRRIAAEAGVNEITLFRHFGSKAALLSEALRCAVAASGRGRCLPDVPVDPRAELLAWSRAGYDHLRRHAAMIRTAMGEMEQSPEALRCAGENPARAHAELNEYLHGLRAHGVAPGDWDPDAATNLLMGALFSDAMGRDTIPQKYPYPPEEAPERYVTLFLRAIGIDGPGTPAAAAAAPEHDPGRIS